MNKYFQLAIEAAKLSNKKEIKDKRSFFHGAVGIRNDGAIVKARNESSDLPNRCSHAEYRLSKKLDYGAIVYVVRVSPGTGELANSKPCHDCMKALLSKSVKKIFYSIGPDDYEVIHTDILK